MTTVTDVRAGWLRALAESLGEVETERLVSLILGLSDPIGNPPAPMSLS